MSATHGSDLIKIFHPTHRPQRDCVRCGENCSYVALVSLVYTFEPCDCDEAPYTHLVERPWHRRCFTASDDPEEVSGQ